MANIEVYCMSNGNGNGWPSQNEGQKSGGGRDNNPPSKK
tara:strand:+ start:3465 stop:3581 length:117 start_codon:yes stop_codon:yes gene_type:complete